MNNHTDEIKVKEEPVESEEDKTDLPSSNIKPESPILPFHPSKSKETKTSHRKSFSSTQNLIETSLSLSLSSSFHLR